MPTQENIWVISWRYQEEKLGDVCATSSLVRSLEHWREAGTGGLSLEVIFKGELPKERVWTEKRKSPGMTLENRHLE